MSGKISSLIQYTFEGLDVWQKSRVLVKEIYLVTSKFPADEKFGLTSQLRRAAVSVCSNIAEGSTRWSKKDKARFYEISYGSLIEILNQSILSNDLEFMTDSQLKEIRLKVDHIAKMLSGLYNSTKSATNRKMLEDKVLKN